MKLICNLILLMMVFNARSQDVQNSFKIRKNDQKEIIFHGSCNTFFTITLRPDSLNKSEIKKVFKGTFETVKDNEFYFRPFFENTTHLSKAGERYKYDLTFDPEGSLYKVNKDEIIKFKTRSASSEKARNIAGFFYSIGGITCLIVAPMYAFFRKDEPREVLKNFRSIVYAGLVMEGLGITASLFNNSKTYHIKTANVPNNLKWSFD